VAAARATRVSAAKTGETTIIPPGKGDEVLVVGGGDAVVDKCLPERCTITGMGISDLLKFFSSPADIDTTVCKAYMALSSGARSTRDNRWWGNRGAGEQRTT